MDQTFSSQLPGKVLADKFRIERVLGTGGMGVVVAAEHLQLRQRVAIKLLLPELLQRADIVGRFEREARATARLKNDHVARILDVGTLPTGAPFIVMEYLEGRDLSTLLARDGVQRPEDAVLYVLQACEALAEAHAAGIVHRDLKPQNLFLTQTVDNKPLIKVLDFGVSRFADSGADVHLTRTSVVVGSPAYMAPEQMRAARNADERSDIWSLGVVLYELLTGRLPFEGETVTDLYARVVSGPPPMPEVSPALSAVILRCLSVDPAERPPSVSELSLALAPMAAEGMVISERILAVTGASRPHVVASSPKIELDVGTARTVATDSMQPRRRALAIGVAGVVVAAGVGIAAVTIERQNVVARPSATPPPSVVAAVSAAPPIAASSPLPLTVLDPPIDAAVASVAAAPPRRAAPKQPQPISKPATSAPLPAPARDDPFQNRTSF
jgi:serine/threonine-protein kinase